MSDPNELVAAMGSRTVRWDPDAGLRIEDGATDDGDLRRFLGALAALPSPARALVLEELVSGLGDDPTADDHLGLAREALRERHPTVVIGPARPRATWIELFARLDDRSWYLRGWTGLPPEELRSLTLVAPNGDRADLTSTMARYPRLDIDDLYSLEPHRGAQGLGLATLGTVRHTGPPSGWLVEVEATDGTTQELSCPEPTTSPLEVRRMLLAELALDRRGEDRVLSAVLHESLQRVEERRRRDVAIDTVDVHGTPPADPEVTVIVPLYGRLDFLEHQMAQFVHDPAMSAVQLVYVLDQPERTDEFRGQARRLHRLYRVPFTLVTVTANAGFSGANNLGASVADGRLLLLCNSDILPAGPGWLPDLVSFHDRTPAVGAVSPKLLFEDGSIQHAGMYFDRPDGDVLWQNEHYFKGLAGNFPGACVSRPVPAVTAACLLTDRRRYEVLGGLRGQFLQGDYEDSDFCMRLRSEGLDSWYSAEVELFHLEGMSYPGELRAAVAQYNKWLHTQIWDDAITEVMADPRVRPGARVTPVGVAGGG